MPPFGRVARCRVTSPEKGRVRNLAEGEAMRSEEEIKALLAEVVGTIDVVVKRRLDRGRLAGTIGIVSALEWALGQREDGESLVDLAKLELNAAVKHANR